LQLIRAFLNRPEPGIVVSVDLMSTGVDIPDLECIVFLGFSRKTSLAWSVSIPLRREEGKR
jgi:superfamily II DNA or RNA helicase